MREHRSFRLTPESEPTHEAHETSEKPSYETKPVSRRSFIKSAATAAALALARTKLAAQFKLNREPNNKQEKRETSNQVIVVRIERSMNKETRETLKSYLNRERDQGNFGGVEILLAGEPAAENADENTTTVMFNTEGRIIRVDAPKESITKFGIKTGLGIFSGALGKASRIGMDGRGAAEEIARVKGETGNSTEGLYDVSGILTYGTQVSSHTERVRIKSKHDGKAWVYSVKNKEGEDERIGSGTSYHPTQDAYTEIAMRGLFHSRDPRDHEAMKAAMEDAQKKKPAPERSTK